MKKNNISIIIPNYNSGTGLEKCISSIYSQIDKNDSIIIVDDCSTDNSLSYISDYLEKENIILLKHKTNKGVSYSRNDGLKKVKTEWVTFIDGDDTVDKDYFSFVKTKLSDETQCMSFEFNYIENTSNKIWIKKCSLDNRSDFYEKILCLEKNDLISSCCNKIYSTKVIKDNKICFNNNAKIMEDYEFNIQYFKHIDDIAIIDKAFYNYIYNGDVSASSMYKDNLLKRFYEIKKIRNEFYKTSKYQYDIDILNSSFLVICINNLYKRGNPMTKKERKEELKEIINLKEFKLIKRKKNKTYLEKIICFLSFVNNVTLIDINFKLVHFIKNNFGIAKLYFRKKNRGN